MKRVLNEETGALEMKWDHDDNKAYHGWLTEAVMYLVDELAEMNRLTREEHKLMAALAKVDK